MAEVDPQGFLFGVCSRDRLVIEGVHSCAHRFGVHCAWVSSSVAECLAAFQGQRVTVVLFDAELGEREVRLAVKLLGAIGVRLVVWGGFSVRSTVIRALRAGTTALLHRHTELATVFQCIRTCATIQVPSENAAKAVEKDNAYFQTARLSPREEEIRKLSTRGLTIAEMASELGVSYSTVRNLRSNLAKRIGVRGRKELRSALQEPAPNLMAGAMTNWGQSGWLRTEEREVPPSSEHSDDSGPEPVTCRFAVCSPDAVTTEGIQTLAKQFRPNWAWSASSLEDCRKNAVLDPVGVVVVDTRFDVRELQEFVREQSRAGQRLLLWSDLSSFSLQRTLLLGGAWGVVGLKEGSTGLFAAIEAVLAGSFWPTTSDRNISPRDKGIEVVDLSSREREVLRLVEIGLRNHEIGERLGITSNTVKLHRYKIGVKLGVSGYGSLRRALDEATFRKKWEESVARRGTGSH